MDNTLIDELGSRVREELVELLKELQGKYSLVLWTNSTKVRAVELLKYHKLYDFFDKHIYRENYDPDYLGKFKSIDKIGADLLIDDDPKEINHNKKRGNNCFLIKSFRKSSKPDKDEIKELRKVIINLNKKIYLKVIKSIFKEKK